MCVYFYCTLRVLIKKSKARPGNKSGKKEEKIGQQDDQTIFFSIFQRILKDYIIGYVHTLWRNEPPHQRE